MSYYPREVIDDIRSGNDIVDVVGQYVKLKRSGSSYVGLCPFHNEKTPSFHVHSDGQYYHCFGCGVGGDVIGFMMQYGNYSYLDALRFLADRINYVLPEAEMTADIIKKRELKQNLYEIHKVAARFYYEQLISPNGKNATEYLDSRQVKLGARRKFGLGYSPIAKGALYEVLKSRGFSEDSILKSGLVYKKDDGNYFDKFFNRLMFPIIDVYGNIIGFGGRILGEGQPKYLNSPETEIFNKSRNLYNLNNAKAAKMREFILVEGYMDAIAIYQAGFYNVVASLGTAFNENHAKVLKSYADSVILLFDSDEAGVKAVLRAIPVLENAGLKIKVLQVHDAKDPDEFIKKFGALEFGELLKSAKNHIIFQAEQIQKKYNLDSLDDKIAFSKDIASLLSSVESSIETDAYLKEVSRMTQIDLPAIQNEISKLNNGVKTVRMATSNSKINKNSIDEARGGLISILVSNRVYYDLISPNIKPEEFVDDFYIKTVKYIYSLYSENKPVSKESIISFFDTVEEQSRITKLFVKQAGYIDNEMEKALNHLLRKVKEAYYDKMISDDYSNPKLPELMELKRNVSKLYISLSDG
ncbi:MAG: DNA primase [Clostridia bacterium]|nr:DNA primase [Clostridia bacterium]